MEGYRLLRGAKIQGNCLCGLRSGVTFRGAASGTFARLWVACYHLVLKEEFLTRSAVSINNEFGFYLVTVLCFFKCHCQTWAL